MCSIGLWMMEERNADLTPFFKWVCIPTTHPTIEFERLWGCYNVKTDVMVTPVQLQVHMFLVKTCHQGYG